jgi:pimeloyl-ACP methyl ester carboxylesterase
VNVDSTKYEQKTITIPRYEIENLVVPEHKLAFLDWNSESSNTVICVHGLIANAHDFDYLAEKLSLEFRVISIDIAGRGSSDYFDNQLLYTYPVYIADTLVLLESLGIDTIHWIGTSMGGIMGMIMASSYPHMIRSLVLNDIGPEIPGNALAKIRKYVGIDISFPNITAAKKHIQMLYKNFGVLDDEHWDHLVQHTITQQSNGMYKLNYDTKIAETFVVNMENPEDVEFWDIWHKIICPTLLIHGIDSDILLQSTVDKMSLMHSMNLYKIHDAGHAPALVEDDDIDHIYDWLQNISL